MKRAAAVLIAALLMLSMAGCISDPVAEPPRMNIHTLAVNRFGAEILPGGYTPEQALDFFADVAFSSEYEGERGQLCRWTEPVKCRIGGKPTQEDLEMVERLMQKLNSIEGFPGIETVTVGGNLTLSFVPAGEFENYFSSLPEGRFSGFCTVWWDTVSCDINRGVITVSSEISQSERNTVILEELTQSMGLLSDSDMFSESVMYGGFSTPQWLCGVDSAALRMLYHPSLNAGMERAQALEAARKLLY